MFKSVSKSIGMVLYLIAVQLLFSCIAVILKANLDPEWMSAAYSCLETDGVFSIEYFKMMFSLIMPALVFADIVIAAPLLIKACVSDKKPFHKIDLYWCVFILAFGIIVNYIVSTVVDLIPAGTVSTEYSGLMNLVFSGNPLVILSATGIAAPIIEEVIFRYYICNFYSKRSTAVFMSALLFGLAHMNLVQSSYAFVIGLLLAWLYVNTGNLLVPVLLHVAINLSSVIFEFVNSDTFVLSTVIASFAFVLCTLIKELRKSRCVEC